MPTHHDRRTVHFESLDAMLADAQRLLDGGYQSQGKWTLGQTCYHLAEWARFPMDGFPQPPWFLRAIFGVMKKLGIVERMKRGILEQGFRPGTPTAPQTVPDAATIDDAAGFQQLVDIVARMKAFAGEIQPSPLFDKMDRETWTKVTLLHAEHHLSFLSPSSEG